MTDLEFDSALKVLKDVFSRRVQEKNLEVNRLKDEVVRKDAQVNDLKQRISYLELQLEESTQKLQHLTSQIGKLSTFKQSVIESLEGVREFANAVVEGRSGVIDRVRDTPNGSVRNNGLQTTTPSPSRSPPRRPPSHDVRPSSGLGLRDSQGFNFDSTLKYDSTQAILNNLPSNGHRQPSPKLTTHTQPKTALHSVTPSSQERTSRASSTAPLSPPKYYPSIYAQHVPPPPISGFVSSPSLQPSTPLQTSPHTRNAPPKPNPPATVDGRAFFRAARSRLTYDEFTVLLQNIKSYNARMQSRNETVDRIRSLFGDKYRDLYNEFCALVGYTI